MITTSTLIWTIILSWEKKEIMVWKNIEYTGTTLRMIVLIFAAITLFRMIGFREINKVESLTTKFIYGSRFLVAITFNSTSLTEFLIAIEIASFPIFWIIIKMSKDKDKISSLKFIIFINIAGSTPFIIFLALTCKSSEIIEKLLIIEKHTYTICIIILLLVKTPLFITHVWLTKAHVSASGTCSMILARIIIKIGTIGLLKFKTITSFGHFKPLRFSLAATGILIITLLIIRFFDIKTLIAISSVLHIRLILPIAALNKSVTLISMLIIIAGHGVISFYLFIIVTNFYEKYERRNTIIIRSQESQEKYSSIIVFTFIVLNLGLPPLANFYSEVKILLRTTIIKRGSIKIVIIIIMLVMVLFLIQANTSFTYEKKEILSIKMPNSKTTITAFNFIFWSFAIFLLVYFFSLWKIWACENQEVKNNNI